MIFYFSGPDGSGKTHIIKRLQTHFFKDKNISYIWVRSPKILSKPLMLYCRLVGLTKYFRKEGIRYGVHMFYRSKFVSWVFPYLQYIDLRISLFFILRRFSEELVLIDRFSLDTLADLMVDTNRFDLHKKSIGKKILNTIPENTHAILISANEEIIRDRKPDTRYDPNLKKRIMVYKILGNDLNLKMIFNNDKFCFFEKKILEWINSKYNERYKKSIS